MEKLDNVSKRWEEGTGKERASYCRQMQEVIFHVRPKESVITQAEPRFFLGQEGKTSAVLSFLKVVRIMKGKLDLEEKEGYTQEDHDSWALTVDSICTLIEMGLPAGMEIFSDKMTKPGDKVPRNKNSKIASYLQHLKVKKQEIWEAHTKKIKTAVTKRRNKPRYGDDEQRTIILDEYIKGMEFDQGKVSESDDEGDSAGLFTGMANVDWLLLAAYHLKHAGYTCDGSIQLLKGVAAFSLLCPVTKVRAEALKTEWPAFAKIHERFQVGKDLYMCPLALTPSRLVNCAATMFEAASDICILRGEWTILGITEYVARQLEAHGGIATLNKNAGTTSSVEWIVHRLLLNGANCSPSRFVKEQKNPLKTNIFAEGITDKDLE